MAQPFTVDADSHVLEPPDLWENYLEPKYRDRGIHIRRTPEGEQLIVDNEVIMNGRLALLGGAENDAPGLFQDPTVPYLETCPRASMFTDARVKLLDEWGVSAGITFPTGVAPESAKKALATDSTGIGAFQGNLGLALEQIYGSWLVNATILAADRLPRTANGVHTKLGLQLTTLAAVAYTLPDDSAVAVLASYTFEGDATIDGHRSDDSGRRLLRFSLAGAHPFTDTWKLQGSLFYDPPVPHLDQNQTTSLGFTLSILRSWT